MKFAVLSRILVVAVAGAPPVMAQGHQAPAGLAELETRAQQDSLDARVLYTLAMAYDSLRRWSDEERVLHQVLAIDPHYAPAYLGLGLLPYARRAKLWEEEAKGKVPESWRAALDSAHRRFREAFLLDPLVDFRIPGTEAPPEQIWSIPDYGRATTRFLLVLGIAGFGVGRYELSYDALRQWAERRFQNLPIDSVPDFLFWYRGLAAAHLRAWDKAVSDFEVLLARSTKQERSDSLIFIPLQTNDYRYVLAVLKQHARRVADAAALYQEALANDLGLFMAHVQLARMYRDFQQWDQAVEEARRAVQANPDDPALLVDLGMILREGGRLAEAEEVLGRAEAANPRNAEVPYALGMVRQQLGHRAEARTAFTRFVQIAPSRFAAQVADARQRLSTLQ